MFTASNIENPAWGAGALILASVINVPLFLLSIFLLQTKFRPEMQEDSYYSKYLESKTGYTEITLKPSERSIPQILESNTVVHPQNITVWYTTSISVNKNLLQFPAIVAALRAKNIFVRGVFGEGAEEPDVFQIAVGSGLAKDQIKEIVEIIKPLQDGWIDYAFDGHNQSNYDNQILIGAYGDYEHGMKFDDFLEKLQSQEVSNSEAYKLIGR